MFRKTLFKSISKTAMLFQFLKRNSITCFLSSKSKIVLSLNINVILSMFIWTPMFRWTIRNQNCFFVILFIKKNLPLGNNMKCSHQISLALVCAQLDSMSALNEKLLGSISFACLTCAVHVQYILNEHINTPQMSSVECLIVSPN